MSCLSLQLLKIKIWEKLVLQIKNKLAFIKKLLNFFDFIETPDPSQLSAKEREWLNGLEEAVRQVNEHKGKKATLKSAKALFHE